MAEPSRHGYPDAQVSTSSLARSPSPDWEFISSSSSSNDSASEDSAMQGLSVPIEPTGLLHDYFSFEPSVSNVPSTSMVTEESVEVGSNGAVQQIETESPSDLDGAENFQAGTSPVAVSHDSSLMESVEQEEEEDVSRVSFGMQVGVEDVVIEAGEPLPQGLSQVPEPSTLEFDTPSPGDSNSGMQQSELRLQESDHEAGEPADVPVSEPLGERDNTQDAIDLQNRRALANSNRRRRGLLWESWLRRQLAVWQVQLRKANTLWSLALAAAVMGLLILGRGWRRLEAQNRILRLQLQAKDKKITQLMFQLIQMKESFSKSKQIPVIRTKPSLQIPQDRM